MNKKPLELTKEEAAELFKKGTIAAWRSDVGTEVGDKLYVKDPANISKNASEAEIKETKAGVRDGIRGILMSIGLI